MRLRGVLAGSLVLIALQAVTASDRAAGRVGSMLSGVAGLVRLVLDPSVPAIPDLGGAGTGTTGAVFTPPPTSRGLDDEDTQPPRRPTVARV